MNHPEFLINIWFKFSSAEKAHIQNQRKKSFIVFLLLKNESLYICENFPPLRPMHKEHRRNWEREKSVWTSRMKKNPARNTIDTKLGNILARKTDRTLNESRKYHWEFYRNARNWSLVFSLFVCVFILTMHTDTSRLPVENMVSIQFTTMVIRTTEFSHRHFIIHIKHIHTQIVPSINWLNLWKSTFIQPTNIPFLQHDLRHKKWLFLSFKMV